MCPPALHIDLGLFLKHFKSLELACSDLDVKVAATLAKGPKSKHEDDVLGKSYLQYVELIRSASSLDQQAEHWQLNADHLQEQLTATLIEVTDKDHPVVQMLSESIQESRDQHNEMVCRLIQK